MRNNKKTTQPYALSRFEHAASALRQVVDWSSPADSCLSYYFRQNPQIGQNDRIFIAETVYFIVRHFTSLSLICQTTIVKTGKMRISARDLLLLVYSCKFENDKSNNISILPWRENIQQKVFPLLTPVEQEFIAELKKLSWPPNVDINESATLDLPQWLINSLSNYLSQDEIIAFAQAQSNSATLDLRVNTLKISVDDCQQQLAENGIKSEKTAYSTYGLRVNGHPALFNLPLFTSGAFEVQDEGSQLVCQLVAPKRGEAIFDFCAGAGGKTLMLGQLMRNTGRIYAADISSKRLANLKPRLARSGLSNIFPMPLESEHDKRLKRHHGKIDRVLVDAPCSGSGTFRRNPDLKWRRNSNDIAELAIKQINIINNAAKLVKENGYLIYATCSVLQEENQAIIKQFLDTNQNFKVLNAAELITPYLNNSLNISGDYLQLATNIHQTDGFFAAIMQKISK